MCRDSRGNYWIADPPNGFIKMYDPVSGRLVRFRVEGAGIASSCRIRTVGGKEYLYVTEIKQNKGSREYDGDSIIIIPVDACRSVDR